MTAMSVDPSSVPSPTLSEMDFDKHDDDASVPLAAATKVRTDTTADREQNQNPSPPIVPPPAEPLPPAHPPKSRVRAHKSSKAVASTVSGLGRGPRLSRFLPRAKQEAFIGPMGRSAEEAIHMIQRECPSLSHLPAEQIALRLQFDSGTAQAVHDVLFRVLPEAWPNAVSEVLPLVHVDRIDRSFPSPNDSSAVGAAADASGCFDRDGFLDALSVLHFGRNTSQPAHAPATTFSPPTTGGYTCAGKGQPGKHRCNFPNHATPAPALKGVRAILASIEEAKKHGPLPPLALSPDRDAQGVWADLVKDGTLMGIQE